MSIVACFITPDMRMDDRIVNLRDDCQRGRKVAGEAILTLADRMTRFPTRWPDDFNGWMKI